MHSGRILLHPSSKKLFCRGQRYNFFADGPRIWTFRGKIVSLFHDEEVLRRCLRCNPGRLRHSTKWIAEDESGDSRLVQRGDTLEITAPKGADALVSGTVCGDYRITYEATVLMEEGLRPAF